VGRKSQELEEDCNTVIFLFSVSVVVLFGDGLAHIGWREDTDDSDDSTNQ
jgi:hypothetical protein